MRLRLRLILFIAFASLVPLGLLGLGATRASTRLMVREIAGLQGSAADGLATYVDTWLGLQLRGLQQQVSIFALEDLDDSELNGYLRLVAGQAPEALALTLTDRQGHDLSPPLTRSERDRFIPRFRSALPLDRLDSSRPLALGLTVQTTPATAPVLPVAVLSSDQQHVLGVALSLSALATRLQAEMHDGTDVALLDAQGGIIAGGGAGMVVSERLLPFLAGTPAEEIRYATPDGREVLAACAPVSRVDWTVAVAEPLERAQVAVVEIQRRTAFIAAVAAVLAIVVGVLFSRQISVPVEQLKEAALAVADGDLGRRLEPQGSDELAELTHAFNFMSSQLADQQAEIEAFNRELQARVEARTRQLRETQQHLLESERLAAVGEMSAGLAHELNNPIAGILGLAQVLVGRAEGGPSGAMLRSIEEQAMRCKQVLGRLIGLSGEATRAVDPAKNDVVDMGEVLTDVMELMSASFEQRGVKIECALSGEHSVRGDPVVLGQAFAQLMTTIRAAAPAHSLLRVQLRREAHQIQVLLELEGEGLRTGGDDWMASGLGLWSSRRVFDNHGGRLEALGLGRWRVSLPQA